jgi:hypothetical protein
MAKLVIGLFLGDTLVSLLQSFPVAFLAVMVIGAGLELASVGESLNTALAWDLREHAAESHLPRIHSEGSLSEAERKQRWTVMLITAGFFVAFKSAAIGFLAGMLCDWSYGLPRLFRRIPRDME